MAVQTQIQVRRGTASSWTSTNPTLAAGEWGLETDTGKYKVGDGSSVWTGLGYASILPSTVTTKGDLLAATGSGAVNRLAAGSNGYTLVADSSTSTGLAYSPTFFAGKNAVINGDFRIWQRGTSFSSLTDAYTADRWKVESNRTGTAVSQQTFTPGTAPVSGYEGQFFLRYTCGTSGTYSSLITRLEDVRLFANQTVTLSYWAKCSTGTITNDPYYFQNFGSGGSAEVQTSIGTTTITTSWQRFTQTFTINSISGKTIGTSSYLAFLLIRPSAATSTTIDVWGVQLEAGSTATQFQTATGTIQGELAACQRYYWRFTGDNTYDALLNGGIASSTTSVFFATQNPVTMRVQPTAIDYSTTYSLYRVTDYANEIQPTAIALDGTTDQYFSVVRFDGTGFTQYRPYIVRCSPATAGGYIGISAEL